MSCHRGFNSDQLLCSSRRPGTGNGNEVLGTVASTARCCPRRRKAAAWGCDAQRLIRIADLGRLAIFSARTGHDLFVPAV